MFKYYFQSITTRIECKRDDDSIETNEIKFEETKIKGAKVVATPSSRKCGKYYLKNLLLTFLCRPIGNHRCI